LILPVQTDDWNGKLYSKIPGTDTSNLSIFKLAKEAPAFSLLHLINIKGAFGVLSQLGVYKVDD
jgi:hypothetical protein